MPSEPSTPRGLATYARVVEAATAEFAEHGIAGARVERVVQAARTNKAQLYAYFGDKDRLFDAVLAQVQEEFTRTVTIEDGDLAGWAVRLYDAYLRRPDVVRLVSWARLERYPRGSMTRPDAQGGRVQDPKTGAVASAQASGRVGDDPPDDVVAMVIAMSMAWSPVSNVYAAHPDEAVAVHDARKRMLHAWVARATAPR